MDSMDDSMDEEASYIDQLYDLFDYMPSKKKKYKHVTHVTPSSLSEGIRMRYNMHVYDTYHGVDGWEYNLLTGKLEKKKKA